MSITTSSRIALAMSVAVAGLACAHGPVAAAPAAKPVVAAPAPADAKSQELVERMCSGCHDFSQVSSQNRTDTEWAETLDRMIGYGMQTTPDDQKVMRAFLAAHYGKKAN